MIKKLLQQIVSSHHELNTGSRNKKGKLSVGPLMLVKVVSFPSGCVTLALLHIPLKALPPLHFIEEGTAVGCGVFLCWCGFEFFINSLSV